MPISGGPNQFHLYGPPFVAKTICTSVPWFWLGVPQFKERPHFEIWTRLGSVEVVHWKVWRMSNASRRPWHRAYGVHPNDTQLRIAKFAVRHWTQCRCPWWRLKPTSCESAGHRSRRWNLSVRVNGGAATPPWRWELGMVVCSTVLWWNTTFSSNCFRMISFWRMLTCFFPLIISYLSSWTPWNQPSLDFIQCCSVISNLGRFCPKNQVQREACQCGWGRFSLHWHMALYRSRVRPGRLCREHVQNASSWNLDSKHSTWHDPSWFFLNSWASKHWSSMAVRW